jgi:RimJ/RimL family protein N-acetyltransferase
VRSRARRDRPVLGDLRLASDVDQGRAAADRSERLAWIEPVQPRVRQNLFDRRRSHCSGDSSCAGVTEPAAAILLSVSSGPASLASSAAKGHWEVVYGACGPRNVSWCQPEPEMSLVLIERLRLRRDAAIIDVGGGASRLAARLLARGFTDLTVLDISNGALELARAELGADASRVSWIEQDLLSWSPPRRYDLWHDRAVFHFFVDPRERERYAEILRSAISAGGMAIIGAFAADGPERCCDLPVLRFDADGLTAAFGGWLVQIATLREEHRTPAGSIQPFTWVVLEQMPPGPLIVTLRDGASILVRPIAPEDKPLLVDVFGRLTEESRYWRFFMNLRALSPAMLADFTEVDHFDHEAVIAIEPSSGQALGVARYARLNDDPEAAEVAVTVVDDWHRRGVASTLLAELSARAKQEGVRRFVAIVRADNPGAAALFRTVSGSKLRIAGPVLEFVIELGHGNGWSGARR